ncbi:MAG: acetyltransferase [Flavobacteriales bacterium]|nr:acetyltransferase [Flavobacteriales bacterium]
MDLFLSDFDYIFFMKEILIIGASSHAKVVLDIFKLSGKKIIGFIDDNKPKGDYFEGYKILGKINDISIIIEEFPAIELFVAIGDNYSRKQIFEKIKVALPKISFAVAIHPRAIISEDVKIEEGAVLMAGAIVNPGSSIARGVIINTGATVDHDCFLDAFSSLAPGVSLGGNVQVGKCSAISIGAIIKHGITVAEHSVVGAGSVVLKDIPAFSVAYGVPARVVRKRLIDEKYL